MKKFIFGVTIAGLCVFSALWAPSIAADEGHQYQQAVKAGNFTLAAKILQPLAQAGDMHAQYILGVYYSDGIGVSQSDETAFYWMQKSALQDFAKAQMFLGVMYKRGRGVTQSNVNAVYWYKKSADQGNSLGQFHLANMIYQGHGTAQSNEAAIVLFKKSAAQGEPNAKTILKRLGVK
ncbi:MAG: hypothetical protein COA91_13495 [Robiginitomaculum sp.]|nr:MAG: hypothetical protein COA91_13495 [Robiginitomaculum sp.]